MKKLLSISTLLISSLILGCSTNTPEEQAAPLLEELAIENIAEVEMKSCPETIQGLQFAYPASWGECGLLPENEIFFQKELDGFREALVFHAEKLSYWNSKSKEKRKIPHDEFEVWNLKGDGCGFGGKCFVIKTDDKSWFRLIPAIVGSNKTPGRIEQPDDFPREEINAVIASIKLVDSVLMEASTNTSRESTGKSSDNLRKCSKETLGLNFKYPENWTKCQIVETNLPKNYGEIHFSKMLDGFEISLIATLREVSEEYALGGSSGGYFSEEIKITVADSEIAIFPVGCGGGSCHGLSINDKYFYEIRWDVKSTQPIPEFLTYKWVPDYDFTPEDMLNILKSVERVD